jgi:hypothetical protein
MLLSKALHLTDTVTDSVTARLPRPLAGPVHVAVSTLTWVPRQVVEHVRAPQQTAAEPDPTPTATDRTPTADPAPAATDQEPDAHEPEVVLTLDRPAEEVEPPIDVVGEALRAETPEQPAPLEDEGHVELQEAVVYSTASDDS